MAPPIYFHGAPVTATMRERELAASYLLRAFDVRNVQPADPELPYLFCGNGACRDCNVLVDGLSDVPACRVPLAPGLSLRAGDGAGEPNALSRKLPRPAEGPALAADVAVVGAGPAGTAAAETARRLGASVVWLEARAHRPTSARAPCPVSVEEGSLFVYEGGDRRRVEARAVILATGARDVFPAFAGSTLPGVHPMDLVERYVASACSPGRSLLLVGRGDRAARLAGRLEALESTAAVVSPDRFRVASVARAESADGGALRVRLVPRDPSARGGDPDPVHAVDAVVLGDARAPSLSLAKALGCETFYDRRARVDRIAVEGSGRTSIPGVLAAGDVVSESTESEARDAGRRAGTAAVEGVS